MSTGWGQIIYKLQVICTHTGIVGQILEEDNSDRLRGKQQNDTFLSLPIPKKSKLNLILENAHVEGKTLPWLLSNIRNYFFSIIISELTHVLRIHTRSYVWFMIPIYISLL